MRIHLDLLVDLDADVHPLRGEVLFPDEYLREALGGRGGRGPDNVGAVDETVRRDVVALACGQEPAISASLRVVGGEEEGRARTTASDGRERVREVDPGRNERRAGWHRQAQVSQEDEELRSRKND